MPKLPKTDDARPPAKARDGAEGGDSGGPKATRRKVGSKRKAAGDGAAVKDGGVALAAPGFQREAVDRAPDHEPEGPATVLSDSERELLGDLFAVIEEHAAEAPTKIDKGLVERAFV